MRNSNRIISKRESSRDFGSRRLESADSLRNDSVGVSHSQIFRPKGSMIVACYGSEPSRSFVFGPKPHAQHPFDFQSASSTTISWRPPHRERLTAEWKRLKQNETFQLESLIPQQGCSGGWRLSRKRESASFLVRVGSFSHRGGHLSFSTFLMSCCCLSFWVSGFY